MLNAGVAFVAGGPRHLSVVWAGDLFEVDLFQADGPWRVVVAWAALFPVAAVAGAALSIGQRRGAAESGEADAVAVPSKGLPRRMPPGPAAAYQASRLTVS